ncbi:MAG: hypothetical protein WCY10_06005, partial [Candidatus Omnitrophota bacterium]
MLEVDKGRHDQTAGKNYIRNKPQARSKICEKKQKDKRRHQFNDKITQRDPFLTIPATACQNNKAYQRDIEIPRNGLVAFWTVRPRPNDGFSQREPVNTDIKKTTRQRPQNKYKD